MGLRRKITGIISNILKIGLSGPNIKNNSGVIEARNPSDSGFAIVRGDTPVGVNDLCTKSYTDTEIDETKNLFLDAYKFIASAIDPAAFLMFGEVPIWDFDDGSSKAINLSLIMPQNITGDIRFFVWFSGDVSADPGEVTRWRMQADFFTDGEIPSAAPGTFTFDLTKDLTFPGGYVTDALVPKSVSADFTLTGGNPGELLVMRFFREGGAAADTFDGIASFYGFQAEYD